ncbi:hypothetical protein [Bosea sp. BIWAKO-01]|nr:hypothetical protein [Bosea sp. BIWAKO-01]GAU86967.1 hypothetical protein BIWAKO_06915 [Bosea sp. BIWAKO-01]
MRQFVQNAMAMKRMEIAVVTFSSVNVVNDFCKQKPGSRPQADVH